MKMNGLMGLMVASLCLWASAARADEKAGALLKEVAAAEKAAQTLTADVIWLQQEAGQSDNVWSGTVKLKKPNLVSMTLRHFGDTGDTGDAWVSDGKTLWMFEKARNQYMQMPADGLVFKMEMEKYIPLGAFLNPDLLTRSVLKASRRGEKTIGGTAYQVVDVEIKEERLLPEIARLYIGSDKRVHRAEVHLKGGGPKGVRFELDLLNVKTGQALTKGDFVFQPPKGAKEPIPVSIR